MALAFCWEHHRCTRPCRVRELGALFCWQVARREGLREREECEACSYRRRWERGEFAPGEVVAHLEGAAGGRRRVRVLVADDEPNILYALEEAVRGLGHECLSACDGAEALLIARAVRPDLVITDVIMPRLNGLELCERLKGDPETSAIPVVLVTVRAADKDLRAGDRSGADAYITKPFQMHDLEETITRLASRRRP
jgi:CheY-like chemotaxis protein